MKKSFKFDQNGFYSVKTFTYRRCCNLCASISKCASVNYDVKTQRCDLQGLSATESELLASSSTTYGTFVASSPLVPKEMCRSRPCKQNEICVMTKSGEGYTCLQGGVCSFAPGVNHTTHQLDYVTVSTGQATYACDTGFVSQVGSGVSTCTETDGWIPPTLVCERIDCGQPPLYPNITLDPVSSTLYLDQVHYRCNVGYNKTEGDAVSVCQSDGQWSTVSLKCKVVDCGHPADMDYMDMGSVTVTVYSSEVLFTCSAGFESDGSDGTIHCQADGRWSTQLMKCNRKDCLSPPSFSNMVYNVTLTLYESEAVYECDVGFNATSGDGVSRCLANGSWETPSLICQIVDCGFPPNRTNMTATTGSTTTYSSTASYSCNVGYFRDAGEGASVCQENGIWSLPTLNCSIVDCGSPITYTKYEVEFVSSSVYQSVVVYRCKLGYYSTSPLESVCLDTGQWSAVTSPCYTIPGLVSKGTSTSTNTTLECVTRFSREALTPAASCEAEEVMTGCSALTVGNTTTSRGNLITTGNCHAYASSPVMAIARCCKQDGLQCEHTRLTDSTPACVKNFQLTDCSCAAYQSNDRHCQVEHTNHSCVPRTVAPPNNYISYYFGLCCTSPSLSCYQKSLDESAESRANLTIQCNQGEIMTGCSSYNYDTNIQGAVIQEIGGIDTCVLMPGASNVTTIIGYANCCTST